MGVELRIGRCLFFKDWSDQSIPETRVPVIIGFLKAFKAMQPHTHICPDCSPRPAWKFRLLYLSADLEALVRLRAVLTGLQVEIIACSDRGTAVLFLKSEIPYHLLLIDLEWRGTEGLKLARLARSLRHRKHIVSLLMSATALTDYMKQLARKAGINECLEKTQDMAEAVEAITRLLEETAGELALSN